VRPLHATRIAVAAEALRLRLRARRLVVQVALCVVALVLLISALALAHLAAWCWLRQQSGWTAAGSAGVLAAADFVVGGVMALVALRLGPGREETEARLLRQRAWNVLADTAIWAGIVLRLLRLLRRR